MSVSDFTSEFWAKGSLADNTAAGCSTANDAWITLVFGAEKHGAGSAYPSFDGWLDDVRISTGVRYTAPFARPGAPLVIDATTAALYRFDEGAGTVVGDAGGTSPGSRHVGGPNSGRSGAPTSPRTDVWSDAKEPRHTAGFFPVCDADVALSPWAAAGAAAGSCRGAAGAGEFHHRTHRHRTGP